MQGNIKTLRLYHFLNACYGIKAIKDRRLKLSRPNDLNDPFEFSALISSDPTIRKAHRDALDHTSATSALLCMSKAWSNPLLWSHYADRHRGLCLGFDVPAEAFNPVTYTPRRLSLAELGISETGHICRERLEPLFYTKFRSWRYEGEYRALIHTVTIDKSSGYAFKDFDEELNLREIIIGCRSPISRGTIQAIIESSFQPNRITLRKARPAFKTFKMVNQLDKSLW